MESVYGIYNGHCFIRYFLLLFALLFGRIEYSKFCMFFIIQLHKLMTRMIDIKERKNVCYVTYVSSLLPFINKY